MYLGKRPARSMPPATAFPLMDISVVREISTKTGRTYADVFKGSYNQVSHRLSSSSAEFIPVRAKPRDRKKTPALDLDDPLPESIITISKSGGYISLQSDSSAPKW
jgi:hypothetical protein